VKSLKGIEDREGIFLSHTYPTSPEGDFTPRAMPKAKERKGNTIHGRKKKKKYLMRERLSWLLNTFRSNPKVIGKQGRISST
jgi:hypothetical protein